MSKSQIIELVNAATDSVIVPDVSKQKKEFYKIGVRDLLKQLQIEIDKIKD